jgi:hypothetical protein
VIEKHLKPYDNPAKNRRNNHSSSNVILCMKKQGLIILIVFIALVIAPSFNFKKGEIRSQKTFCQLKKDLKAIINTKRPRNYKNITSLNNVASYIKKEFNKVCDSVAYQSYTVDNNEYKNVIGSIGLQHKKRIIIGAHYDVFGDSDGADDNASGIAGLLEVARLLAKEKLDFRVDFVAYTLEEPPFFRTINMGSYIHAKYLHDKNINVKGMICLESIGYYSNAHNSQSFPMKEMSSIYGTIGDFITVVQNNKKEKFSTEISNLMINQGLINTKSFVGTSFLTGVDFSDHLNYWKFDFEAIMITNTAFYRNKRYHTKRDKLETLDLKKMTLVIKQISESIKQLR